MVLVIEVDYRLSVLVFNLLVELIWFQSEQLTITNGNIVGVAITNPQVFYAPRDVSDVDYTSTSGVTTVTTSTAHGLSQGDTVKLSGIAFTCNYSGSGPVNITNVVYDNTTGIMTVTTSGSTQLTDHWSKK